MLRHQYRGDSSHRIVKLDAAGFLERAGEWTSYKGIATISATTEGERPRLFICVTEYFSNTLVPDRIYEASTLDKLYDGGSEAFDAARSEPQITR